MKPLLSESHESKGLQALGRASVQVVHDLKNQINSLKLYATFLRKRMEKDQRPPDELETINKLLAGLDRTATDLSLIMQFGQPVEIRRQPNVDLQSMVETVVQSINDNPPTSGALKELLVVDSDGGPLMGEFDAEAISEALRSISIGAIKMPGRAQDQALIIRVEGESIAEGPAGIIEWHGLDESTHDPFNSFVGSDGLKMALAARVVEAHGRSAERRNGTLRVRLPLEAQA